MSSPDPNIISEMAKEVDALLMEGVDIPVRERDSIAASDTSSSGYEEAFGSDLDSHHRHRIRAVQALEQRFKCREDLRWYEVASLYLNHSMGDIIR